MSPMRPRPIARVLIAATLVVLLLHGGPTTASQSTTAPEIHLDCADRFHVGANQRDLAGMSLALIGDLSGDGQPDLAIGAPYARPNGPQSGAVHILTGTAFDDLGQTSITFTGEDGTDQAGTSVAAAGDVNGDGHADLLIGAPYSDAPNRFAENYGAAYLIHGPRTTGGALGDADAIIRGTATGRLGTAVAGVGDVNGDGFDDILVAASHMTTNGLGDGAAYLFHGPVSGQKTPADADVAFIGVAALDRAGVSLAGLGDVNGDGLDDFAIGTPHVGDDHGAVYVIHGAASDPSTVSLADADATFTGLAADDWFGFSIAGVGDVTGDGRPDLVVGAVRENTTAEDAGAAYVFASPFTSGDATTATATLRGESIADEFGVHVARVGDITGDGVDDIGVGADTARVGPIRPGSAYVFAGGPTLSGEVQALDAALIVRGLRHHDAAGRALAGGTDLDGDGHADLFVSAPGYERDPDIDNLGLVIGTDVSDALVDLDGDLLSDACETLRYGTMPDVADTDGDGVDDGEEVLLHGSDPLDPDTDGDLFSDGTEVAAGSDPTNPHSVPTPIGPVQTPGPRVLGSTPVDDQDPLL